MIRILADQNMGQKDPAPVCRVQSGGMAKAIARWLRSDVQALRGRTMRFTTKRPGTYSSSSVSIFSQRFEMTAAAATIIARRQHFVDADPDGRARGLTALWPCRLGVFCRFSQARLPQLASCGCLADRLIFSTKVRLQLVQALGLSIRSGGG